MWTHPVTGTLHRYARGLRPIMPGRIYPKLSGYMQPAIQLPTPPPSINFGKAIASSDWQMCGNDTVGDCFFAAFVHLDMALRSDAGQPGEPLDALTLYRLCTGYDPAQTDANGNNPTDQGTDPVQGFSWLQSQGYIIAWAEIDKPSPASLWAFGGHILGCAMPDDADAQFEAGGPFNINPGSRVPAYEDHAIYMPQVAPDGLVTWGQRLGMTKTWEDQVIKRRFVVIEPDLIGSNGLAECGLDLNALKTDCQALARMATN